MPIIRKKLAPSDVYPDDIRYNPSGDQVEVLIDGVWTPAPESDPRTQTTLPPRVTADTRCDAAQSVADALENQITQIATAIDNTLTVFQIAGLILGLLSFGVFAIFINIALAIADYMIGLGATAIEAALPPSAYDDLKCILYCHMDENGRVKPGELIIIQQEVVDQLGATGGTIINQMLQLAGEGGINGMASTGTSTGDCSACPCADEWCYLFDFINDGNGGWAVFPRNGVNFGTYELGSGWVYTDAVANQSGINTASREVRIARTFISSVITKVTVTYAYTFGASDSTALAAFDLSVGGTVRVTRTFATLTPGASQDIVYEPVGGVVATSIQQGVRSSRDISAPLNYSGNAVILAIRVEGTGTNPFGEDNCP